MCNAKPGLRCLTHTQSFIRRIESKIETNHRHLNDPSKTDRQKQKAREALNANEESLQRMQIEKTMAVMNSRSYGYDRRSQAQKLTDEGIKDQDLIQTARRVARRRREAIDDIVDEQRKFYADLCRTENATEVDESSYEERLDRISKLESTVVGMKKTSNQLRNELTDRLYTVSASTCRELSYKIGELDARHDIALRTLNKEKDAVKGLYSPITLDKSFESGDGVMDRDFLRYNVDSEFPNHGSYDPDGIDYHYDDEYINSIDVTHVNEENMLRTVTNNPHLDLEGKDRPVLETARELGLTHHGNWRVDWEGGYYGDEIGNAVFENKPALDQFSVFLENHNKNVGRTHVPK